MFGSEIKAFLLMDSKIKNYFRGVFASDTLPVLLPQGQPHTIVVNLDHSQKEGSHWCAIFISAYGVGIYFDPIGLPPFVHNIRHFLEKNCSSYQCNDMVIQNILSYTCGLYCIYFLRKMIRGVSLREFQSYFKAINTHFNDEMICRWYNQRL